MKYLCWLKLMDIQDVQTVLQAFVTPSVRVRMDEKQTLMIVKAPEKYQADLKTCMKKRMHISLPTLYEEPTWKELFNWKLGRG